VILKLRILIGYVYLVVISIPFSGYVLWKIEVMHSLNVFLYLSYKYGVNAHNKMSINTHTVIKSFVKTKYINQESQMIKSRKNASNIPRALHIPP